MDDRTRPRPSKDAVRSDVPHAPWASRVRTLESDARRQAVLDRRRRREMGTDEAAPLCEGGRLAKRLMRGDIPPFDDQPEAPGHFVRPQQPPRRADRKSVVSGKSVLVRLDSGGARYTKTTKKKTKRET